MHGIPQNESIWIGRIRIRFPIPTGRPQGVDDAKSAPSSSLSPPSTALSAIVLLNTGCDEEKAVAEKPFRVGVTAGPHAAIVTEAAKVAAKNGLKVEVVEFTRLRDARHGPQRRRAFDAAVYQHEPFLLNFNKQKGTKLANVGNAVVQPMGFYSRQGEVRCRHSRRGRSSPCRTSPTNCGRGLLLLQAAGLIKLPEGMGSEASLADIVENKRNLKIRELEAAQLPRSLDDALVAVIPMNYVISAGLSPQKQGFYFESLEAPFALIIIAAHHGPQERQERSGLRQVLPLARSQGLRRKDLQRHDQAELVITAFCA